MKNIFRGDLVRLTTEDPEPASQALSRWARDSEYARLLDNPSPLWSAQKIQSWIERDFVSGYRDGYFFEIRSLDADRLVGFTTLFGLSWNHGDTWMAIGLGERSHWGKGYGTDAVRVMLRYAFTELNLRRISLWVYAYNPRAVRAYEKAGFKVEGRLRQYFLREGQRHDMIMMGALREEWLQEPGGSDWSET
jgi:RimJ/RimL family protein N-acetyltransferase